jgi:formylmethanofuran dehydrogenase subunit E
LGLVGAEPRPGAEEILARVAQIHGNPGVFAVAGYRMGERALTEMGLQRGTFSLVVTHRTPLQVQYSCVADGWQAATGVSAGKLNLKLVEATRMESEAENPKTGTRLVFRLRPEFVEKYLNTPFPDQARVARQVLELPEDQIFEMNSAP